MAGEAVKKGILITFEGIEGCGKSTHIRLLQTYLRKKGKKVFLTREPGGTKIGDRIREVLLDVKSEGMSPVTETLLYMASRAQLVSQVLRPELKKGRVVLCDRWMDSTVAYQGHAGGIDARWIEALGREATQGVAPKLTIFLDLPVRTGLARAKKRRAADRIEKKSVRFHEAVRGGFLRIAKAEPRRFRRIVIDPHDSIESVQARVRAEVERAL